MINRISSVLVATTFSRQSAGTESWRIIALDRVCQNASPFSWASLKMIQYTASWYTFHLVVYGTFRGFVTSWGSSSLGSFTTYGCEEYCLSSFFRIFSSCNQPWLDNGTTIMRRTSVIDVPDPTVGNFHVILHWRINIVPSRVALDSTHVEKEIVRVQTLLKPLLVTSFLPMVHPLLIRPFWCVRFFTTQPSPLNCSIIFSGMALVMALVS